MSAVEWAAATLLWLWRLPRIVALRLTIRSNERFMARSRDNGILDPVSERYWRLQLAADRARLAQLGGLRR